VTSVRFEVEQVAMIAYQMPVVLARVLAAAEVALTSTSTLGGYAVAQLLEIPRGLRADGSPRVGLFAFALANPDDLEHFAPGQVVVLEPA
jgi:hypothetical protein